MFYFNVVIQGFEGQYKKIKNMKENLEHERHVLFYGSSKYSCYKKNVNFEKRTNIGFDIYYSRFMDQNNPE
jgi:hypothetical protein